MLGDNPRAQTSKAPFATFGEAVVTVAEVFELSGLNLDAVMTCLCVVGMFGCYVVLVHDLAEHGRRHCGLRLILTCSRAGWRGRRRP